MFTVIVPAYNAATTIDRCLDALAHQTMMADLYEVIVVDDGSTDDTRARVQTCPGVRLVTQDHAGPAVARNEGVRHARGEIVLFTDADCAPAPDWIERLAGPLFSAHVPAGQSLPVGAKGAYLTQQRRLVARFVQAEYEDKYDRMARQDSIDFVDTYSAAYRRDVLLANGGFDHCFPVPSVEDQELSFRLSERGYRMVFVPQARVYHGRHPETVGAYWRKKFGIGRWKVTVVRQHPGKLWRDSHTPPGLRAQIMLVALGSLCLLGSLLWAPLAWGAGTAGLLFLLTTLPFALKVGPRDPMVAAVSPFLLFVRALALGVGFAAGVVVSTLLPRRPGCCGETPRSR